MIFGLIGYGRFGALWAECLQPYGEVKIYDPKVDDSSLENVLDCDYLFLLVPIGSFESVCKDLSEKVKKTTVIVDACSVKKYPSEVMLNVFSKEQALIATHPLFGPDSVKHLGLKGRRIVISNLRASDEELETLKHVLTEMGLEIFECTPEEHDLQMARSQALVHFLGRGLAALDLEKQDLYTPDYEALLRINDVVNNDTWELFLDMQRYNPYSDEVREKLLEKLDELNEEISEPVDTASARKNIDRIDAKIIQLLAERFKQSDAIGRFKKNDGKAVLDSAREDEVKALHQASALQCGVDETLVESVFEKILETSRSKQSKL